MCQQSIKIGAVVTLLLASTACVNVSSYKTARPVEQGETQISVALEGTGTTGDNRGGVYVPHGRLNLRRGLSDSMDLGLTAGSFGTGVDLNFLLVGDDGFALSASPYVGVAGATEFFGDGPQEDLMSATAYLGLFADIDLSPELTVTLGAKPGLYTMIAWTEEVSGDVERERINAFLVGGSLAVKIDLNEYYYLMPELNVVWIEDSDGMEFVADDLNITFGIALGF